MGQYFRIVNLDKRQYINPHSFNDGAKLLEFGCGGVGTMTALAVLLADGNGYEGGDLHSNHPIIGSWAGDRIVVAGEYGERGKWVTKQDAVEFSVRESEEFSRTRLTLHTVASLYQDVSHQVIQAMADDPDMKEEMEVRNVI